MKDWSNEITFVAQRDAEIAKMVYEIIQLDLKMNPRRGTFAMSGEEVSRELKRINSRKWWKMDRKSYELCLKVGKAISKKDQNEIARWLSDKCILIKDQIETMMRNK